jgi:hypothetical protein
LVLTTDIFTTIIYVTVFCIALFFIFWYMKQYIAVALFGFTSSWLSFIVAGAFTGTNVVSNGVLLGEETLNQFFTVLGFLMVVLTIVVYAWPILFNKGRGDARN